MLGQAYPLSQEQQLLFSLGTQTVVMLILETVISTSEILIETGRWRFLKYSLIGARKDEFVRLTSMSMAYSRGGRSKRMTCRFCLCSSGWKLSSPTSLPTAYWVNESKPEAGDVWKHTASRDRRWRAAVIGDGMLLSAVQPEKGQRGQQAKQCASRHKVGCPAGMRWNCSLKVVLRDSSPGRLHLQTDLMCAVPLVVTPRVPSFPFAFLSGVNHTVREWQ